MKKLGMAVLLITAAPSVLAQAPAAPKDHRPHAKDERDNDPSPQPQLRYDRPVTQKGVAARQVARKVFVGGYDSSKRPRLRLGYDGLTAVHPKWFDVLALHRPRYVPARANGPALVNTDFEFEGISKRDFGYCWGFATLARNFTILAFFDPSAPRLPSLDGYRKLIRDVAVRGRATVIPGYANLRALSLIPELELYMKELTMHLWKTLAIGRGGIETFLKSGMRQSPSAVAVMLADLQARLGRNELPKLLVTSYNKKGNPAVFSKYLHILLVYGLEPLPSGGTRILVWDTNFYTETLERKPTYIDVSPDGTLRYDPWQEYDVPDAATSPFLNRMTIAPENDDETARAVYELRRFCKDKDTRRYCQP